VRVKRAVKIGVSTLRVPAGAPGVLLMGGTFDPPHAGHVEQARVALRTSMPRGSWLVVVPAARSPLKRGAPAAGDRDRLAMVRAAFRSIRRAVVWTDEIDRARGDRAASYWIDTLERLSAAQCVAGSKTRPVIRFLIGADQAAAFHRWRRAREILAIAEPLVVLRAPVKSARGLRKVMERSGFWSGEELDVWMGRVVRGRLMEVSATGVRERLKVMPARAMTELSPRVAEYVERRGLYQ